MVNPKGFRVARYVFRVTSCELRGEIQTIAKFQLVLCFHLIRMLAIRNPKSHIRNRNNPKSNQGQSFEGQKNDPREFLASFQNETAAAGSPSMGYRIILTGILGGRASTASLK